MAASAMRKTAEPLDDENAAGREASRRQIAAALRTGAQDGLTSRGLVFLVGNLDYKMACGIFTDHEKTHIG